MPYTQYQVAQPGLVKFSLSLSLSLPNLPSLLYVTPNAFTQLDELIGFASGTVNGGIQMQAKIMLCSDKQESDSSNRLVFMPHSSNMRY